MENGRDAEQAWGVEEIAKVIGRDKRATYYLLSKGALPARKVRGQWVAYRAKLRTCLGGDVEVQ